MPDDGHYLTIAFDARDVTLTWEARQQLMARLRHVASNARIRDSIQAVGADGLVTLGAGQKLALLEILRVWSRDRDGYEPMPLELYKLRNVLIEDLGQSGP